MSIRVTPIAMSTWPGELEEGPRRQRTAGWLQLGGQAPVAVGQPAERPLHLHQLSLEQLHIGEVVSSSGPPWVASARLSARGGTVITRG